MGSYRTGPSAATRALVGSPSRASAPAQSATRAGPPSSAAPLADVARAQATRARTGWSIRKTSNARGTPCISRSGACTLATRPSATTSSSPAGAILASPEASITLVSPASAPSPDTALCRVDRTSAGANRGQLPSAPCSARYEASSTAASAARKRILRAMLRMDDRSASSSRFASRLA